MRASGQMGLETCDECGRRQVDTGYELVCEGCGLATMYGSAAVVVLPVKPDPLLEAREARAKRRCKALSGELRALCGASVPEAVVVVATEIVTEAVRRGEWKEWKEVNLRGALASAVYHAFGVYGGHRSPFDVAAAIGSDLQTIRRMAKCLQASARAVAASRRGAAGVAKDDPSAILACRYARCAYEAFRTSRGLLARFEVMAAVLAARLQGHRPESKAAAMAWWAAASQGCTDPGVRASVVSQSGVTKATVQGLFNTVSEVSPVF